MSRTVKVERENERKSFIENRRIQHLRSQDALRTWLVAHGGSDLTVRWLYNGLEAEIPAGAVADLLTRKDILDAAYPPELEAQGAWTGYEVQIGTRTRYLLLNGIKGHQGSILGGGRIKVGVIEAPYAAGQEWPPRSHAGWKREDARPGTRIKSEKRCTANTGCVDHSIAPRGDSPLGGHGTMTAQTLAGSIEAGQDPGYPGSLTTDQQQRSGQVPEAYLRYYHSTAGAARPTVGSIIDAAVADGVDVINMSLSTGGSSGNCNKNYNDGATNAAITNATNAGVILVASAGDGGSSSGCNIGYPSLRTEVLSVGELDSSNNANSYTQLPIHSESSRGGMAINSYGGILAGVALIAPGVFTNQYQTSGSSSLYASSTWHGTSFSAPAVAGMVGLMRNAWSSIGWQSSDARIMIANALLMGDGWNGTSTTSQGMNAVTGAGRPRMHWPTSTDLTAPWGWGQRSVSLTYAGQEVSWTVGDAAAEDSRITQWKWAIHYTWNGAGTGGLSDIPDVDFFVDNTCAPGGIVTVASDIGYDNRARFRLSQADIAGKCLRMRVRAVSLPGGPVTVYSADYFHSGITGEH